MRINLNDLGLNNKKYLYSVCEEVSIEDNNQVLKDIIDHMFRVMAKENGIGLAAN